MPIINNTNITTTEEANELDVVITNITIMGINLTSFLSSTADKIKNSLTELLGVDVSRLLNYNYVNNNNSNSISAEYITCDMLI